MAHPELAPPVPCELDRSGVYLCCSLSGAFGLDGRHGVTTLAPKKLHILRHRDGDACRIVSNGRSPLGFVAYVSAEWCRTCPQGPTCPIGQFLLHGSGASGLSAGLDHQSLDLDEDAARNWLQILRPDPASETDILQIEMGLLGLISWSYSRGCHAPDIARPAVTLPLRTRMKVRRAAEILRQRLAQPPTVSELSRQVGLNASDLKRGFRIVYDCSPARYSRETRLRTARDLLTYSTVTVTSIATEVGFSNPSQFSRAFRRLFGCNPSDVRRSAA